MSGSLLISEIPVFVVAWSRHMGAGKAKGRDYFREQEYFERLDVFTTLILVMPSQGYVSKPSKLDT